MLGFTEEIMLLLAGVDDAAALSVAGPAFDCAVAGSVLMDLAFAGRIDTDPETLFVVDPTPTANLVADRVLARIVRQREVMDARGWIAALSGREAQVARETATLSLVRLGIVSLPEGSLYGALGGMRAAVVDPTVQQDVAMRLERALFSDGIPEPRDAALIGLADACGILGSVFPDRDMEACRPRVELLRGLELIARETPGAISDIESGVRRVAEAP